MKRLILVALAVLLLSVPSQAINFGLRGGLNFSSLPKIRDAQTTQYRFASISDAYLGYHFGLMSQLVFPGFYIQPELLYSRTGVEMRREVLNNGQEDVFFTQTYDHLVIPINAGAKFGPVRIGAGPVFSLLLDDSHDFPTDQGFRQELNDFTVGLQFGVGVNLASLVLDLKYETAITNLGDRVVVNGDNLAFDTRPRQFILSIGFVF